MHLTTKAALLIIPALCLSACSQQPDAANANSARAKKAHLVQVTVASREPASLTYTLTGDIRARHSVSLYSQEEGTVTYLPVFEGDAVKREQTVVRLDDRLLPFDCSAM